MTGHYFNRNLYEAKAAPFSMKFIISNLLGEPARPTGWLPKLLSILIGDPQSSWG